MAGANTEEATQTTEEVGKNTVADSGTTGTSTETEGTQETEKATRTFTQAELDQIVKDRLEKANKAAEKKAADARAEAERKAAEEQGNFKTLYEQEKTAREAAETERKQMERERLLDKVAAKHALPERLRNKLEGETEDELEADAIELAKLLKPAQQGAPNIDATTRGAQFGGELTDAKKNELAQRFRI
jgi:hypothetical protein